MGNYGILNPCLVSSVSHHGVGLAAGLSVGDVGRVQGEGLQTRHCGQHHIQHQGDHNAVYLRLFGGKYS